MLAAVIISQHSEFINTKKGREDSQRKSFFKLFIVRNNNGKLQVHSGCQSFCRFEIIERYTEDVKLVRVLRQQIVEIGYFSSAVAARGCKKNQKRFLAACAILHKRLAVHPHRN